VELIFLIFKPINENEVTLQFYKRPSTDNENNVTGNENNVTGNENNVTVSIILGDGNKNDVTSTCTGMCVMMRLPVLD
jgi:hypothetical protein